MNKRIRIRFTLDVESNWVSRRVKAVLSGGTSSRSVGASSRSGGDDVGAEQRRRVEAGRRRVEAERGRRVEGLRLRVEGRFWGCFCCGVESKAGLFESRQGSLAVAPVEERREESREILDFGMKIMRELSWYL